jgi:hypothetical protein
MRVSGLLPVYKTKEEAMRALKEDNKRNSRFSGILIIVISMFFLAGPTTVFGQAFEGSDFCGSCHPENYSDWQASGHPYKLVPAEDARVRPIPLPGGFSWPGVTSGVDDDVSWVIGGFKWKSRYIDKDGYIITVTEDYETGAERNGQNQFNYMTGTWTDYHPGEALKPYDCGSCHTTNWVADEDAETDGDLSDNQDGLPGMWGTFDAGGIHCEQCHGNGFASMNKDTSAELCGTCHIRGDANTIPASGGFIRHHEQYNEFLASPHKGMECVTCHNPHKRSEYSIKEDFTCEKCHPTQTTSYEKTNMFAVGVECIDCHMPKATKSAVALGPHEGDVKTHLFRINTDPDTQDMFTDDGLFVELDGNGEAKVNLDFACKYCHEDQTTEWLADYANDFHQTENSVFRITSGISGTWWAGLVRDGEGWLIDMTDFFSAAFYTYDNMGDQAWMSGFGIPDTGMNRDTVTVDLNITSGPQWGDAYDPLDLVPVPWGTAVFTFTSCTEGTVVLTPNAEMMALGYTTYTVDLVRLVKTNHSCPGTG